MRKKITATDVYKLLDQKYSVDKFLTVPECKIGSTWFKSMCSRFDMWAMSRSWAHPRFIGCEIKVARSDFLNDNKWQNYLPYCSEFYFVSPPDIISPGEAPEQAGLMVTTKNCKRLITKKKAPVRDIEIPSSILIYILMCRTRITSDNGRPRADIWKDRLKEMKADKRLGHEVAYCIRSQAEKRIKDVLDKNRDLVAENAKLQMVKNCMMEFGINVDHVGRYGIERKLREAMSGIPYNLPQYLREIEQKAGLAAELAAKALGAKQ